MAEQKASLIIELKDKVSEGVKSLRGTLQGFRSSLVAVGAAVASVTAFLVSSFKAYTENETAVNKLNVALKNQGVTSAAVSKDLQNFAAQMQKNTTFTDEAIMRSEALFATFGFGAEKIKKATIMAANLSATLGIDLHTATMLVGKALQGQEGALTRYGLSLADVEKMSGAAAAQLNTVEGRITNLRNRIDELQEDIGRQLLPVFEFMISHITKAVDAFDELSLSFSNLGPLRTFGAAAIEVMRMIGDAIFRLIGIIPGLGGASETMAKAFNASLDSMQQKLYSTAQVEQQVHDQEMSHMQERNLAKEMQAVKDAEQRQKDVDAELLKHQEAMTQFMTQEEEIAVLREFYKQKEAETIAKHLSAQEAMQLASQMKRLQGLGLYTEATALKYGALTAADKDQNKKRLQDFEQTMDALAAMSKSKNKVLATIGKAAAIYQITVDTAAGAVAAYRALAPIPVVGPALGAAAAAALVAFGAEKAAAVTGAQLASGGVVMPRSGGTLATIGEGGSREAVIPLDDPEAMDALGGIGGPNITVQAGMIIADRVSVQRFAEMIDEELFRLRKNRTSIAFD